MRDVNLRAALRTAFVACLAWGSAFAADIQITPQDKPLEPANMDPSVKPCEDFYEYANGGWLKNNPVPAGYTRWGSFDVLSELNAQKVHALLERAAHDASTGGIAQKVGDFYASGMDEKRIDAEGAAPLKPDFARIEAIADRRGLALVMAHLMAIGAGPGFHLGSEQDAKRSEEVIATLWQGGLGLPDRDYYFRDDADSVALRAAYVEHVRRMFVLLGEKPDAAEVDAQTVMALETRLAAASMRRVEQRDPDAVYHRMPLNDLRALMPNFPWDDFLHALGLENPGDVNVAQPGFFKAFDGFFANVPLDDWKTYLRWHLASASAEYLGAPFQNESFDFYGRRLTGAKELLPRWHRVMDTVDGCIGEAVGELFVKENFRPEARAKALVLVENLRAALAQRIEALTWMGAATKKAALEKLAAMKVKIGYPARWRDYSGLEIDRDSYVGNVFRSNAFEFHRELAKIGKPVDRDEWEMLPTTVNAYYNPPLNEIVFPAGILQPPFFDPRADDAVNYGGIGVVIGHEMTHGFDDQGRKYDAQGNLRNWWTGGDLKNFRARSQAIVKQFDGYTAIDDVKVNGEFTQGENIADLGGLKIAFAALEKANAGKPEPEKIDGFDWRQRFFLSFAQVWRLNALDEARRLHAHTNSHSPPRYRVIGPLSNLPEFFEAFHCPPASRAESERVDIW
jgi:predicted metalloendopeptidase